MATSKLVTPDFEITVRDSTDAVVLVAGFFIEEDGTTDIAIGWDGVHPLDGLRALLQGAALALSGAITFTDINSIASENTERESKGDKLPF